MLNRCRVALSLCTALALLASASTFAAGDAAHGKVLAYTCLGCHGIEDYRNPYPDYNVPRLAGQHADYIVAALKEYKSGQRSHPTMQVQAATLSDQDMQDIAAYFASEVEVKAGEPTVGVAPGKVTQLCVACHGKDGVGVSNAYPTLRGQYDSYIAQALDEYKSGARKNPVMSTFVTSLTPAEIDQIAAYYAAQTPDKLRMLTRELVR
jgi:cytochrome c553